jgi:hypothetical protein
MEQRDAEDEAQLRVLMARINDLHSLSGGVPPFSVPAVAPSIPLVLPVDIGKTPLSMQFVDIDLPTVAASEGAPIATSDVDALVRTIASAGSPVLRKAAVSAAAAVKPARQWTSAQLASVLRALRQRSEMLAAATVIGPLVVDLELLPQALARTFPTLPVADRLSLQQAATTAAAPTAPPPT